MLQLIQSLLVFCAAVFGASTRRQCQVTGVDIEGPYYHPNAPKAKDLVCTATSPAQDRIIVTGRVLDEDCFTPIQAELDVWHADNNGQYSSGVGDDYECRSRLRTDARGYFKFYSIMPGRYDDDGYRPAHIHFKVKPDNRDAYANITTQLYFENDAFLDIDSCHHCHSNDPTLVIPLTHLSDIKTFVGQWDIVLARRESPQAISEAEAATSGPYTQVKPELITSPDKLQQLQLENAALRQELDHMRTLQLQ